MGRDEHVRWWLGYDGPRETEDGLYQITIYQTSIESLLFQCYIGVYSYYLKLIVTCEVYSLSTPPLSSSSSTSFFFFSFSFFLLIDWYFIYFPNKYIPGYSPLLWMAAKTSDLHRISKEKLQNPAEKKNAHWSSSFNHLSRRRSVMFSLSRGKKMNKSTYLITTLFKRKFNFSFTPVFLFDFWMRYVTNVIFGRHFFPSLPPPTSPLPPPYFPSFPFLYIFFSFLSQTSWYFCDEIFNFINLSCISLVFK